MQKRPSHSIYRGINNHSKHRAIRKLHNSCLKLTYSTTAWVGIPTQDGQRWFKLSVISRPNSTHIGSGTLPKGDIYISEVILGYHVTNTGGKIGRSEASLAWLARVMFGTHSDRFHCENHSHSVREVGSRQVTSSILRVLSVFVIPKSMAYQTI